VEHAAEHRALELRMAPRTVIACHRCGTKNGVRPVPNGRPRCKQCHEPLAWIVDAATETFDEEISSSLPVLVDFWATWCGPCRIVAPALESLARRFAGSLKIVRVDIDQSPALAQRFGVQGVPTLVLLRGGSEVDRRVGAAPERELARWLEGHGIVDSVRPAAAAAT
jgi:thioredoxin 2